MSEITRLNMVSEYWKHSDAGLRDELDRMASGFNFYVGNQWDPKDVAKLDKEKRPHLTINLILPIINLLSGIQRQGRRDITVIARKGGLKPLAAVFTETIRHCIDVTDADYEIADCFLDGVIGNKGWMRRNGERAHFDQQPEEVMALLEACAEAYRVTNDKSWLQEVRRCFDWFMGKNDLAIHVFDFKTGGCHDGLHPNGINVNMGAESTLAWLISLLDMDEVFAHEILLNAKNQQEYK